MDVNGTSNSAAIAAVTATALRNETAAQNRELVRAVQTVNLAKYFGQDQELVFSLDRETHRPIVRLVDRRTKDVIRQIPAEYMLAIARELDQHHQA